MPSLKLAYKDKVFTARFKNIEDILDDKIWEAAMEAFRENIKKAYSKE